MLYKEKKPRFPISAFKFENVHNVDYNLLEHLNIKSAMNLSVEGVCGQCGNSIREHLIYERQSICPNSYIIYEGRKIIGVMSTSNFNEIYEPFVCEDTHIVEDNHIVEDTEILIEGETPIEEDTSKEEGDAESKKD